MRDHPWWIIAILLHKLGGSATITERELINADSAELRRHDLIDGSMWLSIKPGSRIGAKPPVKKGTARRLGIQRPEKRYTVLPPNFEMNINVPLGDYVKGLNLALRQDLKFPPHHPWRL